MKKTFTLLSILFIGYAAKAQNDTYNFKPVPGTVTAEVGLLGGINNTRFGLNEGANNNGVVRFRYFRSKDVGLRFGLGVSRNKSESTITVGANKIDRTDKFGTIELNLGVEKHFAGTNRLSTYVGADLLIQARSAAYDEEVSNGNYTKLSNISNAPNSFRAGTSFGIRLVTGADFYIAKKLYLGTEVGLSVLSGTTKEAKQTVKNGNTITETTIANKGKAFEITPAVITGLRIGYQF
jgi:hypothetical protein